MESSGTTLGQALREFDKNANRAIAGRRKPEPPTPRKKTGASSAKARLEAAGVYPVGKDSEEDDLAAFVERLEDDQAPWLLDLVREWALNWLYTAGYQHNTWHAGRRQFLNRQALPWRVQVTYNLCDKAMQLHVSRLTENKPSVTVQSRTPDLADVERAETVESTWWYMWDRLNLLDKVIKVRRHAYLGGSGWIKTGWDPNAGNVIPRTVKQKVFASVQQPAAEQPPAPPAFDAMGQPLPAGPAPTPAMETIQIPVGVQEFYVDQDGKTLGPVSQEQDVDGQLLTVMNDPPEGTDWYCEGEVFCEACPGIEILFDRFAENTNESWWIMHRRVLPLSRLLSMYPDMSADSLAESDPANPAEFMAGWGGFGLAPWAGVLAPAQKAPAAGGSGLGMLAEPCYRVREVWIWPTSDNIREMWGQKGAKFVMVGNVIAEKPKPLPEWALSARPFIQFLEYYEEGNHYGKSRLRDLRGIQDDLINQPLSLAREAFLLRSRMLLGAPANAGLNMRVMTGYPAMLLTARTADMLPKPLQLGDAAPGWEDLYKAGLSAFADLADRNPASTGKEPSAGTPAKAIYALQYADERSITEVSHNQDLALKQLAESLHAIARVEYTEPRKIQLVGADRAFMVQHEVTPEDLGVDVNFTFQPGSMLARQKESIRNEMLELKDAGLLTDAQVRRNFPTTVPDIFRLEWDQQYAHARRVLDTLTKQDPAQAKPYQPEPWDNPSIHADVLMEWLLSETGERFRTSPIRSVIAQTWQTFRTMQQQTAAPPALPVPGGAPAPAAAPPAPALPPPPGQPSNAGADQLEQAATKAMQPPAPPSHSPS